MLRKLLIVCLLLGPLVASAYASPGQPTGFVNDFAGVLSAEQKQGLEQKLTDYEKKTGNEISVVTIETLAGDSIENYAVKLFADWKIGKKGQDNGLLILVAKSDRQMRIEVGYGLEGRLPDSVTARIINSLMKPAFQAGDFNLGLNQAVDAAITIIDGGDANLPASLPSLPKVDPMAILFFVLMVGQVMVAMMARSKSWWLGGVFGAIVGGLITYLVGFYLLGLLSFVILVPLGLLLDFFISRGYSQAKAAGLPVPWYFGGSSRLGDGGGGFGGFGGGGSGGGGSSGNW